MRTAKVTMAGIVLLTACSQSPSGPPDGPVGSFKVTATTVGAGPKPTLLQLLVDDDPAVILDANGSHLFEDVSVGELVARLVVPAHCVADYYAPRTVEIEEAAVTELSWVIRCPLPMAPGMVFHTSFGLRKLWIANANGGAPRRVTASEDTDQHSPAVNSARTRIAYVNHRPAVALHIMDVDGTHDVALPWSSVLAVDWSPDGSRLAVAEGPRIHIIWPDGVLHGTIETPFVAEGVRWSPDGRWLAYRAGSYMYVVDLSNGNRINLGRIMAGGGGQPAWSPDGSRLAFSDSQTGELWTVGADGHNPQLLTVAEELAHTVDWHPDGRILFGVHEWHTGIDQLRIMPGGGGTPTLIETSPDWATPGRWAP